MSHTDPQFKLRMPPALRARVEQAAKASMRSLNAELVFRVEQSFEGVEVARVLSSNPINALLTATNSSTQRWHSTREMP
ncbi:Arc family DNA-binding protein [Pseudomonas aeruginosa]|nr:Arc family DNA-binding protein [Pseudomonas aeruginosa]